MRTKKKIRKQKSCAITALIYYCCKLLFYTCREWSWIIYMHVAHKFVSAFHLREDIFTCHYVYFHHHIIHDYADAVAASTRLGWINSSPSNMKMPWAMSNEPWKNVRTTNRFEVHTTYRLTYTRTFHFMNLRSKIDLTFRINLFLLYFNNACHKSFQWASISRNNKNHIFMKLIMEMEQFN